MNIYEKLTKIQNELKVPKNKSGNGVKYKFRSVEDIQEASKIILMGNKCAAYVQDKVITVGERYFIEATATLVNAEAPEETITVTAQAELDEAPKMMSKSQNTGSTSSYARKYALGGLYNLDDTGDADDIASKKNEMTDKIERAKEEDVLALIEFAKTKGQDEEMLKAGAYKYYLIADLRKLPKKSLAELKTKIEKLPDVDIYEDTPFAK